MTSFAWHSCSLTAKNNITKKKGGNSNEDEVNDNRRFNGDSRRNSGLCSHRGDIKRKENAQKNRERKLNEFEIAFQNIEFDGREISASELAETLEISAKEMLSWLGEGKRQKKELRNKFEKYIGEDGKTYIRRKGAQECSQP